MLYFAKFLKNYKDIKSNFGGAVGDQTPVRKSDQQ